MTKQQKSQSGELTPEQAEITIQSIEEVEREEAEKQAARTESKLAE